MSKSKKPFKETGVGKFLIEKAPSILGIVGDAILPGNVISELITGNKELSETDKSWLARNVRPLTLIVLVGAYVGGWYMGLETSDTASLLTWVLCGYFGARTADKIGVKLPGK